MLGIFTNNLTVNLALRRHVYNDVIKQLGMTTQPPTLRKRTFALVELYLRGNQWRQMRWARRHLVLLEGTRHASDLASTTQAPATADRIDIHAQGTGGVEQLCMLRKFPALTRW